MTTTELTFEDIENLPDISSKAGRLRLYEIAKEAKVGETIRCPMCGVEHVKSTYHKVFCSNAKVNRVRNCKDRYHNMANEERMFRGLGKPY